MIQDWKAHLVAHRLGSWPQCRVSGSNLGKGEFIFFSFISHSVDPKIFQSVKISWRLAKKPLCEYVLLKTLKYPLRRESENSKMFKSFESSFSFGCCISSELLYNNEFESIYNFD